MKKNKLPILALILLAGIALYGDREAKAGIVNGNDILTGDDFTVEKGDTTVYEFSTRVLNPKSSEYDFFVYRAKIISDYTQDEVFFSLNPTEFITEVEYEMPFTQDGRLYTSDSVYVSNPQLEPTLPGDFYVLTVEFSRYIETTDGVEIIDEVVRNYNMHVTPEPTTLLLISLGSLLLGRRR